MSGRDLPLSALDPARWTSRCTSGVRRTPLQGLTNKAGTPARNGAAYRAQPLTKAGFTRRQGQAAVLLKSEVSAGQFSDTRKIKKLSVAATSPRLSAPLASTGPAGGGRGPADLMI